MDRLPEFSCDDYRLLLGAMRRRGCAFHPIGDLPALTEARNFVCLRHDVDCHPPGALPMAELEAGEGIVATYYILMTGHYNPRSRMCRPALRRLLELGHEIGLHYDLSTYPEAPAAAAAHLRAEAAALSEIVGAPVRTISCHYPHKGLPDPFRATNDFVHCHDPRFTGGMLYVSESSRGWRDENLLRWLHANADASERGLELLTHPEVWLAGHLRDRIRYMDEVLSPMAASEAHQIISQELRDIWLNHDGARMHDERERSAANAHTYQP
jgi:hypothetical protein